MAEEKYELPDGLLEVSNLILKYLQKDISAEEQHVLSEWVEKSERNKQLFDELMNDDALQNEMKVYYESKAATEEFKEMAFQKAFYESDIKPFHSNRQIIVKRLAVAASVIIFVSLSAYFIQREKKNETSAVAKTKPLPVINDAHPGQFKAKLILADGSSIVLDSASSGELTSQGNVIVTNKDGKLIYEQKAKQKKLGTEVIYNTLTTSRGQTYATVLGDGTKVWLNSESSLRYPVAFGGTDRQVEITGEGYFEVEHDASRPFYVKVNGMTIEDLGTHFNVNGYSDEAEIKTTLLEGKVVVKEGNSLTTLLPGQQAKLNKETRHVTKIKDADVDEAVAWKNGYFSFNESSLQEVLSQLARWYDVDIVYEGKVPERAFWGQILRNNNLSQVLGTLKSNDVHFKIEGRKIIVSP